MLWSSWEDINKIIADVKEIPEVKEQCNRAIDIRTQRQIAKFEKQARAEKQPKKKFELASKVKALKKQLAEFGKFKQTKED